MEPSISPNSPARDLHVGDFLSSSLSRLPDRLWTSCRPQTTFVSTRSLPIISHMVPQHYQRQVDGLSGKEPKGLCVVP